MNSIVVKTTKQVIPTIYAYTTPEIARHNGWTKIGYTEQDVGKRLRQQAHTVDVVYNLEWMGNALFEDGSGQTFRDTDFHAYLQKNDIKRNQGTEWFNITGKESKFMFYEFKENRGILTTLDTVISYKLRDEQQIAVDMTKEYFNSHEKGEFLWNAKPRFGKTLATYDLCKTMDANMILIVTNRPAIANSWYSDYEKFFGRQSGYLFVSDVDALKRKRYVVGIDEYPMALLTGEFRGGIYFVSLQDMKGSKYFGGKHDKLKELIDIDWDMLVIDEAHEGVDTYKTDVAFDQIKRKNTLHLSGTPFKALANDKFPANAIFNWTYADEQSKKHNWDGLEAENPYKTLPQLNMFTYQMSEIVKDEIDRGIEIDGETEEYAFDLNEFFSVKGDKFVYESSVDRFLDALTTQYKFPFSTDELRGELKHTLWLLNRVDSAKALAKKLQAHPVFSNYEIVLAAGDGKLSEEEESAKSYDKVVKAIAENPMTITLSVGQLTTGVTIPEWTAVLMLSNIKSPALYMQAAFRAQNPCLFQNGLESHRKENAYVFDFDPARTLTVFEQFANDLASDTVSGRGDIETRKKHIKELLNFFPVIGEDENGEMIELDAEKVLSIPRKIKSQEVVKRGFMSNFLFQNIANIFGAPKAILNIIEAFEPVNEPAKNKTPIDTTPMDDVPLDEDGNVDFSEEYIIGRSTDVFGGKIYEITEQVQDIIDLDRPKVEYKTDSFIENFKKTIVENAVKPLVETATENYGDIKVSEKKRLEKQLEKNVESDLNKVVGSYNIEKSLLEDEKEKALAQSFGRDEEIEQEYQEKLDVINNNLLESLKGLTTTFVEEASKEVVKTIETAKKEEEKHTIEDKIRDHLRGFSRTIPSFLMAYGTEDVTLANFDTIIPDEVFKEVTSISLDNFRLLRDGGNYKDEETGEEGYFEGKLFDEVVFDDSIKEFLRMKKKLANYFDESNTEDIFDYIPPQKTNQIFTPKKIVKKMVDMLEEENPGCFDDPYKTFIDLYMKSGLYITEIVKRLYQSETMKEMFPDDQERLTHIFENQVYGLAPTEIIYRIALAFILGFTDETVEIKHNLRQVDALPYAKEGTLEQKLDEIFG